jgi:hypothetical protein
VLVSLKDVELSVTVIACTQISIVDTNCISSGKI